MSLFQRLTRTLRPTAFRTARSPCPPKIDRNFFASGRPGGVVRGRRKPSHVPYRDNEPMNMRLIYGMIGLNVTFFMYANYTKVQAQQGHVELFSKWYPNMTLSVYGLVKEHRYWTIITSTFSHLEFFHVASNMVSFYYMSQMLAATPYFTPLRLLTLVIGSGVCGGLGYLCLQIQQRDPHQAALGFSGSVMGVGTIAAFLYPKTTIQIYGIIPVPLWALMLGYAFYDGYYLSDQNSRIAHAGHLGGAAFGALYYFTRLRGLRI